MRVHRPSRESLKRELAVETLERFAEVQFVAHGTSMLPSIYPGDRLTVRSFGSSAPCCGEIVLCRHGGEFRIHRIVAILRDGPEAVYRLRGDALSADDPPVWRAELLGRVTAVLRRGEFLRLDAHNRFRHRLLRSIVRRLSVASAILLLWHRISTQGALRPKGSAETRAECA